MPGGKDPKGSQHEHESGNAGKEDLGNARLGTRDSNGGALDAHTALRNYQNTPGTCDEGLPTPPDRLAGETDRYNTIDSDRRRMPAPPPVTDKPAIPQDATRIRADSSSLTATRCTKPGDFPESAMTSGDAISVGTSVLDIAVAVATIIGSDGLPAKLAVPAIGLKLASIADVLNSAAAKSIRNATPDQLRCLSEAHQKQANRLSERSFYKRSF
jgi:hypothetical protein